MSGLPYIHYLVEAIEILRQSRARADLGRFRHLASIEREERMVGWPCLSYHDDDVSDEWEMV